MPDSLEPPTWGAPAQSGCIAAGTGATVGEHGRHVPFSYHLGVPCLSTHVLGAVLEAKFALVRQHLHRCRPCTGRWPDQAFGLPLCTGAGLRPAHAPCAGPGLRPAHAPCTGPGPRPAPAPCTGPGPRPAHAPCTGPRLSRPGGLPCCPCALHSGWTVTGPSAKRAPCPKAHQHL